MIEEPLVGLRFPWTSPLGLRCTVVADVEPAPPNCPPTVLIRRVTNAEGDDLRPFICRDELGVLRGEAPGLVLSALGGSCQGGRP